MSIDCNRYSLQIHLTVMSIRFRLENVVSIDLCELFCFKTIFARLLLPRSCRSSFAICSYLAWKKHKTDIFYKPWKTWVILTKKLLLLVFFVSALIIYFLVNLVELHQVSSVMLNTGLLYNIHGVSLDD